MILLLCIYLLFEVVYDHWATDSSYWNVIYFTFQFGWVGAVSVFHYLKERSLYYIFIAVIFTGLALNEALCLNLTRYEYEDTVTISTPVYGLTIITLALFLIYKIIQWKRKSA